MTTISTLVYSTFQNENEKNGTTVLRETNTTDHYDIAIFGSIGISTWLDVGFRPKPEQVPDADGIMEPAKGAIFGTVNYDSTRANYDADTAATENHEPGIPGITVNLFRLEMAVGMPNGNGPNGCNYECTFDPTGVGYNCYGKTAPTSPSPVINKGKGLICTEFFVGSEGESRPYPMGFWAVEKLPKTQGSIKLGIGQLAFSFTNKEKPVPFRTTVTSAFETPTNCVIRDRDGNPLRTYNCFIWSDASIFYRHNYLYPRCICHCTLSSAFGQGQSVLPDPAPEGAPGVPCHETPLLRNQVGGFADPDGNFKFENLKPGYYALQIEIPTESRSGSRKPAYKVRTEMDVNAYESDKWQGVSGTPVCPSADDTCPLPIDPTPPRTPNRQNVKMPCAGKYITVDSSGNPTLSENGGSHREGDTKVHYCDIKIVKVEPGVNARATFSLFTDVPIPSSFKGLVIDDVMQEVNPKAFYYTEKPGIAGMPVTLRDFTGTKLTDIVTDVSIYRMAVYIISAKIRCRDFAFSHMIFVAAS
jgi:hypothetical protein